MKIHGIDVSPWQEGYNQALKRSLTPADYKKAADDGVRFAWVKATEGAGWVSPTLEVQMDGLHAAGILVGGYHYARQGLSVARNAANKFLATVQRFPTTLPALLDIELDSDEKTLSGVQIVDWAVEWCSRVHGVTGVAPWIYGGASYFASLGPRVSELAIYPWVVASYPWDPRVVSSVQYRTTREPPEMDRAPQCAGLPAPVAWQWTGLGDVRGIKTACDRIVMREGAFQDIIARQPFGTST